MLGALLGGIAVAVGVKSHGSSVNNMPQAITHLDVIETKIAAFDYKGDLAAYKDIVNFINTKVGVIDHAGLQEEELRTVSLKLISLMDVVIRTAELKKVEDTKVRELTGYKKQLITHFGLEQDVALLEFFEPRNHKSRKDAFTSLVLHIQGEAEKGVPGSFPEKARVIVQALLEKFFPNKENVAKWLLETREVKVKKESQVVVTKDHLIVLLIKQGRFDIVDVLLDYCGKKLALHDITSKDGKSIFQLYMEAGQPDGLLKLINSKKINIDSQVLLAHGKKRHIAFDLLYKIEALHSNSDLRKKYIDVLEKLIDRNDCNLADAFDVDGEHFLLKLYNASSNVEELKNLFEKLRTKDRGDGKLFEELRLNERKETLAHIAARRKDELLLRKLPATLFPKEDQEGTTPYMLALATGVEELEKVAHEKVKAAPVAKAVQDSKVFLDGVLFEPVYVNNKKDIGTLVSAVQTYIEDIVTKIAASPSKDGYEIAELTEHLYTKGRKVLASIKTDSPKPSWCENASVQISDASKEIEDALKAKTIVEVKACISRAEKKAKEAQKEVEKQTVRVDYRSQISDCFKEIGPDLGVEISTSVQSAKEYLEAAAALKIAEELNFEANKRNEVAIKAAAILDAVEVLRNAVDIELGHKHENGEGANLLMAAAAGGNLKLVNKFIGNNSFLKAKDGKGACVLHYAGSPEVLNALLAVRIDQEKLSARFEINHQDNEGSTPLMRAVAAGKLEVAKALVEVGADVNICAKTGISPLMQACLNKDVAMVGLLLSSPQIDVNYRMKISSIGLSAIEMIRYLMEACHLQCYAEPGQNGGLNSVPKLPDLYNEERQKLESIGTLLIDHNADKATLTDPSITIEKQKSTFLIFYNVVLKTAFRQSLSSILNLLLLGTKDNPLYTLSDTANKLLFTTEANQHLADELFKEIMGKMPGWKYEYPKKPNTTGMGFKVERRYFLPVLASNEAVVVSSKGILSFIWENVLSFSTSNSHIVDFDPRKIKLIQRFFPGILKKAESTGESIKESKESVESKERRDFKLLVESPDLTRAQAVASHEELLIFYMQLREQMEKSFHIFGAKEHLKEIASLDRKILEKVNVRYEKDDEDDRVFKLVSSIKNGNRKKLLNILVLNPVEYQGFIELISMIRNRRVILAVEDYYEIIKFERELKRKKEDILGDTLNSSLKRGLFNISNGFSKLLGFDLGCDDCKFDTKDIKTEDLVISDEAADERIKLRGNRSLLVWIIETSTGNNIEVNVRKVSAVLADFIASVSTKVTFFTISSRMANVAAFAGVGLAFLSLPYIVTLTYGSFITGGVYGAYKISKHSGVLEVVNSAIKKVVAQVFGTGSNYQVLESEEDKCNIEKLKQLKLCDCSMPRLLDLSEATAAPVAPLPVSSKVASNAWGDLASLPPIILGLSSTVLFGMLAINEIKQGRVPQVR